MVTQAEPGGVGMGRQGPGLCGTAPNSQHLRVETPHPGVCVLQAGDASWSQACFRGDIVSKCLVRAAHPHLLLTAIKGQTELPVDFKPSHGLESTKSLSSSTVPHFLCVGKKLHPLTRNYIHWLGCTQGCMDRSSPAPRSLLCLSCWLRSCCSSPCPH